MEKPPRFGSDLRSLRKERGLSVRALAARSGVSSVWITLVENGRRTIGMPAIEKLAVGLGLREPRLMEFRLSGLTASQRSELLPRNRRYGPAINNILATFLGQMHVRPSDIVETSTRADLGEDEAELINALEKRVAQRRSSHKTTNQSMGIPLLEIRFKDGRKAWFEMLTSEVPD